MPKFKLYLLLLCTFLLASVGLNFESNAQPPSEPEGDRVADVVWSPDGNKMAVAYKSGNVQIIDANTGQVLTTLVGHRAWVSVAWDDTGGEVVTGSWDSTASIWDTITGTKSATLTLLGIPAHPFEEVAWSPDGQYIFLFQTGGDFNLNVWDVTIGQVVYSDRVPSGTHVEWSPDQQRIAISYLLPTVELRDASTFQHITYIGSDPQNVPYATTNGEEILDLAWSPDGSKLVTGALVGQIILWDTATGVELFTLSGNEDQSEDSNFLRVKEVWFSRDGSTFNSISGDGTLRTWDTVTGQMLASSQIANPPIFAAAISPDGTTLAIADATGGAAINSVPIANAGPDQTVVDIDSSGSELVTLDGSGSTDTDGEIVSYSWAEGGVEIATGVSPQVDLAVGAHTITLTVTDDDGATAVDVVVVTVE